MTKKVLAYLFLSLCCISLHAAKVWVETESFRNKGGWVTDQ